MFQHSTERRKFRGQLHQCEQQQGKYMFIGKTVKKLQATLFDLKREAELKKRRVKEYEYFLFAPN
jgi:hypothetical protein